MRLNELFVRPIQKLLLHCRGYFFSEKRSCNPGGCVHTYMYQTISRTTKTTYISQSINVHHQSSLAASLVNFKGLIRAEVRFVTRGTLKRVANLVLGAQMTHEGWFLLEHLVA